ncbi:glycine oxidase ThiO [Sutcliffiella rhizosphaerae]|uniref:glycine oxidase n=1 Tax=Sutcliffiella rhizosphaerae TaxID=2880967 RepID=A0ABN8AFS9_9BACI|nr:glycine oxidase ThiO [Sutcliffiella rhizosphaerae]CAG9622587.1 Glycine oxidase [Sutcliffiella rhizosphaerae]
MNQHYDVIVIGGGVIGCAAAYYLSQKGQKVLLLDKGKVGGKASRAAAGMLGAQVEVTEGGPLFEMAKESRAMFPSLQYELKEHSGIDIELFQKGMLKLAMTEAEAVQIKKSITFQQKLGERAGWLSKNEVLQSEPYLSDSFVGAMSIPSDGHVNPEKLTQAFFHSAVHFGTVTKEFVEIYGFHKNSDRISGVLTNEGDFFGDQIVLAAGAWSEQLVKNCEIALPTLPVKGECLSVVTNEKLLSSTIFSERCYLVPKSGNRIVIGATMIPNTFSENVTVGGISSLMMEAMKILPTIKDSTFEKVWSGIRPQTKDGLPYLGKHPNFANLVVATGHYRNGILLSPLTGKLIANIVLGQAVPTYLKAFSLERNPKGTEV